MTIGILLSTTIGILLSMTITNRKLKWQYNEEHVFWLTKYKVHRIVKWCKTCGGSIRNEISELY